MGGKTATSTQQVAVPPQVLAQYQSVNNQAEGTSTTPFQQYGTTGNAVAPDYSASNAGQFVAGINGQQVAGINATNTAATQAQPYYQAAGSTLGDTQANVNPVNQAATGLAAASAEQVNPNALTGADINQYMSPYLQDVVGSEAGVLNQNNQQQQAGQLGNAITSGAFGSDRTGIAAANLEEQQNLSNASIYSNLLNTGYTNAQGVAQQQQGVDLSAAQANRTALGNAATTLSGVGSAAYGEGANTASELGSLGTGAQAAGLSGAQAQIAAGTVEQQTQQAQDTAQYNQFLQQQSYPFQVDQFLASIAEGTGSLSGSTTTTQQPGGFFSDERLKEDMEVIGRTFDGQPIYRYKMKGDDRDRIGLSAQKVEKRHPDAVGLAGGYRYVDYGKATEEAANRGHFYEGGVVPMRRAFAMGGSPGDDGDLGAVLQAQQQMYGNHGQQQRNISNGGGGSHQLTVASGTPAPPPSGSSNVQQAIGLGKDAYQGYKWMTKPAANSPSAPSGGATPANNYAVGIDPNATYTPPPNYSEGLTGDWQATAAPGGESSGVAGASTDAAGAGAADAAGTGAAEAGAADAAGAGAAEAGAGAAAGAGAGAAAGAAGAAAGAGAADAAAAIAAEYAAADVAAAAIIAAKRGGAIKRHGYDTGGTPYSNPNEQIDIPIDAQTNAHVQTAGPIQKQPTGLQTAMKMGDPNQASGLMGSMFSNEALARGGVAGRRGYDNGGAPSDDETPDVASYGPGVMDADSGPAAATTSDDSPSLWDKVKKHATAENVIPILTGLAAMGTAKTRSPGVALAAGLGAGSQSYLDTRKSLADTANEQAKTQGVDIANQLATMKNQAAKSYLNPTPPAAVNPYSAVSTPNTAPAASTAAMPPLTPTAAATAAQKIDQQYRSQFYVQPWTADEQAALQKARGAAIALGTDEPVKQAQAARDQRVQNDTSANQNVAQAEADRLYAAATDPNADSASKQAALAKYNAIHQWTGDGYEDKGGVTRNTRTGNPAIGTAATQISPQSYAQLMSQAQDPVNVPQSDNTFKQVPRYQYAGFKSPEEYAARNATAAPSPTGPSLAASPPAAARRTTPTGASPPAITPPSGSSSADLHLTKALADPAYKLRTPPVVSGVTASPAAIDQQHDTVASRKQILKDSEDATNAGSASLQYLQAAKAIMDSKGRPVTGLFGAPAKAISSVFGGVNATNYQEVAKYLGNAAIQSGKANFPNATQSEVGLQLNELSPNLTQTDSAINELLDTNIRSSKYTVDSANRVKSYLDAGGDPQNFHKWNQAYYPREKLINQPSAPPAGTVRGGYTFNGGDPADKSNWSKVRQ